VNSEPTRLACQPVMGRAGFKFFWFAQKWAGLDWFTKSSIHGGSSSGRPDYPFWQL